MSSFSGLFVEHELGVPDEVDGGLGAVAVFVQVQEGGACGVGGVSSRGRMPA